jgi:hypothetical protein
MWSRFFSGEELDTEGTLFKGTFDAPELLSLKLAWLCPVTPTVGWSVRSLSRFWLDSHHGPAGGYWQLASEA